MNLTVEDVFSQKETSGVLTSLTKNSFPFITMETQQQIGIPRIRKKRQNHTVISVLLYLLSVDRVQSARINKLLAKLNEHIELTKAGSLKISAHAIVYEVSLVGTVSDRALSANIRLAEAHGRLFGPVISQFFDSSISMTPHGSVKMCKALLEFEKNLHSEESIEDEEVSSKGCIHTALFKFDCQKTREIAKAITAVAAYEVLPLSQRLQLIQAEVASGFFKDTQSTHAGIAPEEYTGLLTSNLIAMCNRLYRLIKLKKWLLPTFFTSGSIHGRRFSLHSGEMSLWELLQTLSRLVIINTLQVFPIQRIVIENSCDTLWLEARERLISYDEFIAQESNRQQAIIAIHSLLQWMRVHKLSHLNLRPSTVYFTRDCQAVTYQGWYNQTGIPRLSMATDSALCNELNFISPEVLNIMRLKESLFNGSPNTYTKPQLQRIYTPLLNERQDVYSLGSFIFYTFVGKFEREQNESMGDAIRAVCDEDRRPIVPRKFEKEQPMLTDLMHRCWGEPASRPTLKKFNSLFQFLS